MWRSVPWPKWRPTVDYLQAGLIFATIIAVPLVTFRGQIDSIGFPKEFILYVLVGVSLLVALVRVFTVEEFKITTTIFTWLTALFAIGSVIGVAVSHNPWRSWYGTPETFVAHGTLLLTWLMWFWLVVHTFRRRAWWLWGWRTLLSVLTIVQLFFWWGGGATLSPFSNTPSVLAVLSALTLVGYLGHWLQKSSWPTQVWAGFGALIALATLAGLGLGLGWIMATIGLALLTGIFFWQRPRFNQGGFLALLISLTLALWWSIFGSPLAWRQAVPTEISLGFTSSWYLVRDLTTAEPLSAFLGKGFGNFVFTFARFREAAFNSTPFAQDTYFNAPFSTLFSVLIEQGWLGAVLYVVLALVLISFGPSLLRRAPRWQQIVSKHPNLLHAVDEWSDQPAMGLAAAGLHAVENKVVAEEQQRWYTLVAWLLTLLLTATFAVIFFDGALWWVWWTSLGFTAAGLSLVGAPLHERVWTWSLRRSPVYTTLFRFGCGLGIFLVAYGLYIMHQNWRAANYYYHANLPKSLELNPWSVSPRLALSEQALARAVALSQTANPDTTQLENSLLLATESAKRATELEPDNFTAWYQLGVVYGAAAPVVTGADAWAVTALEKAHTLAPSNYAIEWQLAKAYAQANRSKDAEIAYRTTIQLKPDFIPAYTSLADLYESQKDLDKAIAVYGSAANYTQKNAEALFRLGRLFFNRSGSGDFARAESVWQQAVSIQPNFSNAYYSLGLLYEKQGNRAAALEQYRKVLALNPDNKDIKLKIKLLGGGQS